MSKTTDMLKSDVLTAAYRVAGNQLLRSLKAALLKLLKQQGTKRTQLNAVAEFLDSELGEAALGALVGVGLNYAPYTKDDPRALALAQEFRINGMATAGSVALDSVIGEVLPSLLSSMKNLPILPNSEIKVRVLDSVEESETQQTIKK